MTLVFSQGGEGSLGGPAFLPRGTGLCPHRQAGHVRTRASTRVHAIPRGASSRVSRSPAEGGAGGRGRTEPLGQPEYRRRAECSTEGSREAASEQSRTGTSEEAELGFLGWPRVRRRRAGQGRGRGRGGARRGGAVGQEVPAGTQDSGGSAAAAGRPPAAVTPPPPQSPGPDRPPPAGGDTRARGRRGEGARKGFTQHTRGPQTRPSKGRQDWLSAAPQRHPPRAPLRSRSRWGHRNTCFRPPGSTFERWGGAGWY